MQEASDTSQDGLAHEVNESLGLDNSSAHTDENAGDNTAQESHDELPQYAKEKIGKLQKRHRTEARRWDQERQELLARLNSQGQSQSQNVGSYSPPDISDAPPGIDPNVHAAVSYALQHKEMQERKAKEAEQAAHVSRAYQDHQTRLDAAADKYDDFHDVVYAPDAPYTHTMRDTSVLLPNAADVLYKLGKNRDELQRISQLPPIDQAKEMVKLSMALINDGGKAHEAPKTIGQIKSTPVSPNAISDQTSVGELRKRMRDRQGWK